MSEPAGEAGLLAAVARAFDACPAGPVGIAVSGGGDSLALLHLAHRIAPDRVRAVTVDHGLRPESAEEAARVAAFCAVRAIDHSTLRWAGPPAGGNLMDQARLARRQLISDWAGRRGVRHVLLGHTADDQAETLLMNLARAAGLDGLSGLRPVWRTAGLDWHRPLLAVPRAALRRYLAGQGVGWIDDPSNENDRFARARARKALQALAPLGVSAEHLAQSARHLAAARASLQDITARMAEAHVQDCAGALQMEGAALDRMPPEIARRLLQAVLRWMTGTPHPPREAKLDHLRQALAARRDATLGGLRFCWRQGAWLILREGRGVQGPVPFGQIWDHRWDVTGPALAGAEIRPLGDAGLRLCPDWRDHGPREALRLSPSVWDAERLIAAPLAGKPGLYRAELTQGLAQFILSH